MSPMQRRRMTTKTSETQHTDVVSVSRVDLEQRAYLAGLNVAHLIASPKVQPVNCEKLRTHLSIVTTLMAEGTIVQKKK